MLYCANKIIAIIFFIKLTIIILFIKPKEIRQFKFKFKIYEKVILLRIMPSLWKKM